MKKVLLEIKKDFGFNRLFKEFTFEILFRNHKHSYSISDPGIFYWPPLYVKSELRSISNLQQNTQHDLQQNRDEDLQQNPDTKLHVSEQYSDVAKPDNCAVNLSNGDFIAAVYDNVRFNGVIIDA